MDNYSLYENLNLYFPNNNYNNIINSIDEILILSQLQNYIIYIEKIDHRVSFSELHITTNNSNELITIYFDCKIHNKLPIFDSATLYYREPCGTNLRRISCGSNLKKILNQVKSLL